MTHIAESFDVQTDGLAIAPGARLPRPWPPRPWREIGLALLFLAAAMLLWVLAVIVFTVAAIFIRKAEGWRGSAHAIDGVLVAVAGMQLSLVWMVVRRAKYLGGGVIALGLSIQPIRRKWLLELVGAGQFGLTLILALSLMASPVFRAGFRNGIAHDLTASVPEGPVILAIYLFSMALLAPVWEELMFRGWLWTELRRAWGVWPTALTTAGMWLALHLPEGPRKVLVLLPLAVVLCLVRHHGGTVRATIVVHIVNNAVVLGLSLAVLLLP